MFPLGSQLEELEAWGRLLHVVLCRCGGRSMSSMCSSFSCPPNAACVGLCGTGGVLQPHPRVFGFSPWCLVLEYLLVILLMRGSKLRNDLCCHLGDLRFFLSWLHFFVVFSCLPNCICLLHNLMVIIYLSYLSFPRSRFFLSLLIVSH